MGIFDRLGNVIKSYINYDDIRVFSKTASQRRFDPDLDAAYEELDDFLKNEDGGGKPKVNEEKKPVPEEIKKAFAELGLTLEASAEDCKEAYKKLLKIHHPDHHANHPENMKKATEKTTRVNAAYERLMEWFRDKDSVG